MKQLLCLILAVLFLSPTATARSESTDEVLGSYSNWINNVNQYLMDIDGDDSLSLKLEGTHEVGGYTGYFYVVIYRGTVSSITVVCTGDNINAILIKSLVWLISNDEDFVLDLITSSISACDSIDFNLVSQKSVIGMFKDSLSDEKSYSYESGGIEYWSSVDFSEIKYKYLNISAQGRNFVWPVACDENKIDNDHKYTDKDIGVAFDAPSGWDPKNIKKEQNFYAVEFWNNRGDMIIFQRRDSWEELSYFQKMLNPRSSFNNEMITEDDIRASFEQEGVSIATIEKIQIGGTEYWKTIGTFTYNSEGLDATIVSNLYVHNGISYEFSFMGNIDGSSYNVYQELLLSIEYDESPAEE